jgi:hypothetical protein
VGRSGLAHEADPVGTVDGAVVTGILMGVNAGTSVSSVCSAVSPLTFIVVVVVGAAVVGAAVVVTAQVGLGAVVSALACVANTGVNTMATSVVPTIAMVFLENFLFTIITKPLFHRGDGE